jgi:CBS domain-containing protein
MNLSEFDEAYDDDVEHIRGAVLETPVSELMVPDPLMVDPDTTVVSAVAAMNERRAGCVLVQKDGKLVGIFTERDVLRKVIFQEGHQTWKVEAVMTPKPQTLPPTASVAFALNQMSVAGYRHIPIVDRTGKPVGVLSVKDIVHFVVELFPGSVLNLPPDADKAIPTSLSGG